MEIEVTYKVKVSDRINGDELEIISVEAKSVEEEGK